MFTCYNGVLLSCFYSREKTEILFDKYLKKYSHFISLLLYIYAHCTPSFTRTSVRPLSAAVEKDSTLTAIMASCNPLKSHSFLLFIHSFILSLSSQYMDRCVMSRTAEGGKSCSNRPRLAVRREAGISVGRSVGRQVRIRRCK